MLLNSNLLDKKTPEGHHPTGGVGNATLTLWRSIAEEETGRTYHSTLARAAIAQALDHLAEWHRSIRQDGSTAMDGCWIWTRTVNGKDYATLRHELPVFGGNRTKSLGRVGSADHRDMERRIKRRDALAEIERMALTLGPMTEALLHVVDPGIDAPLVSARKNPRQGRASEVLEAIASLSPDERRIVLAELMEVAA
jgi:hypothetical protein